jgi:hypothetical protein
VVTPEDLNDIESFFSEFPEWCSKQGVMTSTACARALGNTYALNAIRRRHARLVNDLETLKSIMESPDSVARPHLKGQSRRF